ncbi:hypothetical protein Mgra_00003980 [Meloidogyne graminicola]|uniref:Kazal-like domain-containing protein n=1 Tax=Meloidogyne graminicola TaxID=189291 RepID=A0A8S9ZTK2_9BILA|nr:hypothetical protein Mgra_00003980 [Meloidogyne graminicola]
MLKKKFFLNFHLFIDLMFNLYFNKIFFLLLIIIFNSIFIHSIDVLLLDCPCPRLFHPVCGNDKQTYDNQCLLECSRRYNLSLKFVYEGTCCPNADLCANYFDPVCDQFGNFYANDCIFDFNKCLQHKSGGNLLFIEGRGEQECATAIANAAEKRLQNKKNFNNDNIKRRINNEENINGRKEKNNPCHFFCDETVVPVCDSQFRTHKNRCKFELTVCRLHSRGIFSSLHIVKEGPCRIEENNFAKFPRANKLRIQNENYQHLSFTNIRVILSGTNEQKNKHLANKNIN